MSMTGSEVPFDEDWRQTVNVDLGNRVDEILLDGAGIIFIPQFLDRESAAELFEKLRSTLSFEQGYVKIYGKEVPQPRLTAWYADPGCSYTYSGVTYEPKPWIDELLELRRVLEEELDATFNSMLANLYRDGSNGVGWHDDREPCFVPRRPIASVSLGATRRFLLRHEATKEKKEYQLESGSLLVMTETTQEVYKHSVPTTKKPVGERINLTWRHYRE